MAKRLKLALLTVTGNNAECAEMGLRRAQKWLGGFVAGWQKTQNGLFCAAGGVGLCLIRLVMGAEKGPRGVCSGAFGVGIVGGGDCGRASGRGAFGGWSSCGRGCWRWARAGVAIGSI